MKTQIRNLRVDDIFEMDGKIYTCTRNPRRGKLGTVSLGADDVNGQGWRIRREGSYEVVITGKKPKVKQDLVKDEYFLYKGKKGEALFFQFIAKADDGTIKAKNPIDGKIWSLHGSSYARVDDVIDQKVIL